MRKSLLLALASTALLASTARAQPIAVNYSVSGSAGNWLLDFTIKNQFSGSSDYSFYWFGVNLPANAISSSPGSWSPFVQKTVSQGSGTTYRDTWYISQQDGLAPGQTLNGFSAHLTSLDAPTTVGWFAYAFSGSNTTYEGGDNFNGSTYNPGFEGSAQGSFPQVNIETYENPPQQEQPPINTVPEPSTYALMVSGLAALGFAARRRNAVAAK